MKLCLANPSTGLVKTIEVEDDRKLIPFFNQRMAAEVAADALGDEFKGYVFKIMGGNDKQGFPMMQGVMTNTRVRLLLKKGQKCFRSRKQGQRKRKSVRGCIVGPDLSALHLSLVRKGTEEIPGLTDSQVPRRLGPKRANKIRRMFNLTREDDLTQFVVKKKREKDGKTWVTIPKITRLLTPRRIARRKTLRKVKEAKVAKSIENRAQFKVMMDNYKAEKRAQMEAEKAATIAAIEAKRAKKVTKA